MNINLSKDERDLIIVALVTYNKLHYVKTQEIIDLIRKLEHINKDEVQDIRPH
jgi:hypothetical protein